MITVILPLRLSEIRLYDEIERLDRIAETIPKDRFQILIVDFGTCAERVGELARFSERHEGVEILRVDDDGPFSIGRARDIGVQHAKTDIVMFHDVDFLCSADTYQRIYKEAAARKLDRKGYDFFTVPTIFLTDAGTRTYLDLFAKDPEHADWHAHNSVLRGKRAFFQHAALGSSATVINRYFYLVSGGHDPAFRGHGAEDFEFYHRLESLCRRAPRSNRYYEGIPYANGNFSGFRAFFALFGQDIWMRGICMVHLDHPRREVHDRAYGVSSQNFSMLRRRMEDYDKAVHVIKPIGDIQVQENTLLLMSPLARPANALRMALPALGKHQFLPEDAFNTPEDVAAFVERESITQTVFLNPYGNEKRAAIYDLFRSRGLRTIAFDRGALPDSWFFDREGFLAGSGLYRRELWNHPLEPGQERHARAYIRSLREDDKHLEKNDTSMGPEYWRNRLGVGERKVIFVALQRPKDVAITTFAGPVGDFDTFLDWVNDLATSIDRTRYVVVVKTHPLETERPELDGVVWCPDGANIHDLIDLCERMVVINSGSGLIAAAFGKPVIVCGEAFYAHPGICWAATTSEELVELCQQRLVVDEDKVLRFVHYLISKAYSFGQSEYKEINTDGAVTKIVSNIDFSVIRCLGAYDVVLGQRSPRLPDDAFLLTSAGRTIVRNPPVQQAAGSAQNSARDMYRFSLSGRLIWLGYRLLSGPFQGEKTRKKMELYPVAFLAEARNPANRLMGRILLPKSLRDF
ncbi:putative glycosyltransferase involved in capsule biosynthesis [Rhodovulum sp. P5]|uniref:capsular polysaccharide export protein, LipB/KpsS family n=1 Tax=Rhodovulum sp. P5 TaxID=1564506 RepID=UPI0009C1E9FB|nr:glycosyltransferase [Rhodovulum sp. P5]ARE39197.1 putative glycosyltransferase involved in capsule biosynthesis [Rhodovulum sp. P5]